MVGHTLSMREALGSNPSCTGIGKIEGEEGRESGPLEDTGRARNKKDKLLPQCSSPQRPEPLLESFLLNLIKAWQVDRWAPSLSHNTSLCPTCPDWAAKFYVVYKRPVWWFPSVPQGGFLDWSSLTYQENGPFQDILRTLSKSPVFTSLKAQFTFY